MQCNPSAKAFCATTLPMLPKPTIPKVLPAISWHLEYLGLGQAPERVSMLAGA